MANKDLSKAKTGKNDEFYTQYHDIETEINAYLEYDPNVFQNKTVLLPVLAFDKSLFAIYYFVNSLCRKFTIFISVICWFVCRFCGSLH
jgi:hypothetical protein